MHYLKIYILFSLHNGKRLRGKVLMNPFCIDAGFVGFAMQQNASMKKVVIFDLKNPVMEVLEVQKYNWTFIQDRALANFSTAHAISLSVLIQEVKVPLTESNCESVLHLPSPVIIVIDEVIANGDKDETTTDEEDGVDMDQTARASDLSMIMNATQAGNRWTTLEEVCLKNFHKYILEKKVEKPDVENLSKWLDKRKTEKQKLFGSRSLTAILAKYKKMVTIGVFTGMESRHKKKLRF